MKLLNRWSGRRTLVLIGWVTAVAVLGLQHIFWRDEVRALSIAIRGDDVLAMLRGLQGEGHPALWYLMLRAVHGLVQSPVAMPILAFAVALAAGALLVSRSPLSLSLVALFLVGRAPLYEYSVMARNYGISMLLMFVFAALYRRFRTRGVTLGVVLVCLANSNVHSVLIAGALLAFWFLDLWSEPVSDRRAALGVWATNAAITVCGIGLCLITVYPPVNDAAQVESAGLNWRAVAYALALPASTFGELTGWTAADRLASGLGIRIWEIPRIRLMQVPMSLLLFGSSLVLIRKPAAAVVAIATLITLSIFFTVIYPGFYRHQALWLCLLTCLLWIVTDASRASAASRIEPIRRIGMALFCILLVVQVVSAVVQVFPLATGGPPESRSRDLAQLIRSRPELARATLMADPDYLLEAMPYYVRNPTYLTRDRTFDNVVVFRKRGRLTLSLDEFLAEARSLRARTNGPVVILLGHRLDAAAPQQFGSSYNQRFETSPDQVRAFLAATRQIARFDQACCSDESFDVYVLD